MKNGCAFIILLGVVGGLIVALKQPADQGRAPVVGSAPARAAVSANAVAPVPLPIIQKPAPDVESAEVLRMTAGLFAAEHSHSTGKPDVTNLDLIREVPPYRLYRAKGVMQEVRVLHPFEVVFYYDPPNDTFMPMSVDYDGRNVFDLGTTIEAFESGDYSPHKVEADPKVAAKARAYARTHRAAVAAKKHPTATASSSGADTSAQPR